jgi:TctA family transporter
MAILLGAFLMHGLVPGPDMLTKNLSITYAMVWSVALANILGAGMCYAFSPQFARLATLRYTLILPAVLGIVYIGAFEASRDWGDLYTLLLFGVVGWLMKQFKWPRPPLVLGLVLGDTIERYMFISIERYGMSWIQRPVVAILFTMAAIGLIRPLLQDIRIHGGIRNMVMGFQAPRFHPAQFFTIFVLAVIGIALVLSTSWGFKAQIIPLIVGIAGFIAAGLSLFNDMCRKPEAAISLADQTQIEVEQQLLIEQGKAPEVAKKEVEQKIHMDLTSDTAFLSVEEIAKRAFRFFLYLVAFMGMMAIIGLIPTAFIFVIVFMRVEGPERWSLVLPYAICVVVFIYVAFDQFMAVPWPQTLVGSWFPSLRPYVPSL